MYCNLGKHKLSVVMTRSWNISDLVWQYSLAMQFSDAMQVNNAVQRCSLTMPFSHIVVQRWMQRSLVV
jgi:hypothetical protein